jgi:hypothetical protein
LIFRWQRAGTVINGTAFDIDAYDGGSESVTVTPVDMIPTGLDTVEVFMTRASRCSHFNAVVYMPTIMNAAQINRVNRRDCLVIINFFFLRRVGARFLKASVRQIPVPLT